MAKQRNPNGAGNYTLRKDGRYMWRNKIDGELRTLYGKTPSELQEKVKKVSDLPITKSKLKISEWFDTWLSVYVKPLKKQATYDQYKILYEQHIKPAIGNRKLSGIKPNDIQSVIAKMNEKKRASKTMKHVKSIMNIAFTKAFDEKLIPVNPVKKIEIPTRQAKPRKTLTIEELSKLYEAMKNSRWIWSVRFMLVTGLRRGELLALKWTDIDFDNRKLVVKASNSKTGLGETKSAKVHYVPLSDVALQYLDQQKEMLKTEYNPSLHNEKLKKDPLVFPNESGTMIRADSYYTMLSRFAKKAEIKVSPHCLRHTFVFFNREAMTLKELQNALGHDESTTTLDIYGDIITDSMVKTASKINDVFAKVNEEIQKVEEKKKEETKKETAVIYQFKAKTS